MTEYEKVFKALSHADQSFAKRRECVKKYSWAIPNQEAIDYIAQLSNILEIGSGNGYWAYEIEKAHKQNHHGYLPKGYCLTSTCECGIDCTCKTSYITTDIGGKNGHFEMFTEFWRKPDHLIEATEAIKQFGENRSLLVCWPTYDADWSSKALEQYMKQGGKRLIYIGEPQGGCTGDDLFHELRYSDYWKDTFKIIDIPTWDGINDYVTIHERNR